MYMHDQHVARALTIAGSDSGGGAGIQADLKTMQQFQVYGTSVMTAITAQNTLGVQGIMEVDPAFVSLQLQSVMADIGADAMKTGMLSSAAIIGEVADFLARVTMPHVVVDPVMIAKGGAPLLRADAISAMKERLLPIATIVTPNIPEAETLCGFSLDSWDACRKAAFLIADMGPDFVIIKGGHMTHDTQEWATDLIYRKNAGFTYLTTPRILTKKSHGTGCTYSAAITAMLARGATPLQAITTAKTYVYDALFGAKDWDVGSGHGPIDHSVKAAHAPILPENHRYALINNEWIPWEDDMK